MSTETPDPAVEPAEDQPQLWEIPTVEDPVTEDPVTEADAEPDGDTFSRDYVQQLRQENGRYRQQLRERDAQLDAHRRADAERMVGNRLLDASLLWAYGSSPSDLVGEDGRLSPEKVDAAVATLLDGHPQFRSPVNPAAPASLVGWDASNPLAHAREPVTAQAAFRRALGRDG